MGINYIPDLGAPLLVAAADIITANTTTGTMGTMKANEYTAYVAALGGFAGAQFMRGKTSDFLKNVMIASLPWAARKLYQRMQPTSTAIWSQTSAPARMQMRNVSRYPAPAQQSPFEGVRLI